MSDIPSFNAADIYFWSQVSPELNELLMVSLWTGALGNSGPSSPCQWSEKAGKPVICCHTSLFLHSAKPDLAAPPSLAAYCIVAQCTTQPGKDRNKHLFPFPSNWVFNSNRHIFGGYKDKKSNIFFHLLA